MFTGNNVFFMWCFLFLLLFIASIFYFYNKTQKYGRRNFTSSCNDDLAANLLLMNPLQNEKIQQSENPMHSSISSQPDSFSSPLCVDTTPYDSGMSCVSAQSFDSSSNNY